MPTSEETEAMEERPKLTAPERRLRAKALALAIEGAFDDDETGLAWAEEIRTIGGVR